MKIKDKTLKITIAASIIVAVSVASFFLFNKNKSQEELFEEKIVILGDRLGELADYKYEALCREYEFYVDMAKEFKPFGTYAAGFLHDLDILIETPGRYTQSGVDSIDIKAFEERQEAYEKYDKKQLRDIAIRQVKK